MNEYDVLTATEYFQAFPKDLDYIRSVGYCEMRTLTGAFSPRIIQITLETLDGDYGPEIPFLGADAETLTRALDALVAKRERALRYVVSIRDALNEGGYEAALAAMTPG